MCYSRTWQIVSKKSGRTLATILAHTAAFALEEYARSNGGRTWQSWCIYLGLSFQYTTQDETSKILID